MGDPRECWTRWLAGACTDDAAAGLACDLASDRELAGQCADDGLMDRRLRLLLAPPQEGDAFTRAFAARLRADPLATWCRAGPPPDASTSTSTSTSTVVGPLRAVPEGP